ncbi:MAG: cobalt transporter CbiM [Dehalococcoidia bacterium]|nr:cobalt transporter CbiM [Dehalococcoidia bacterium]
MHIPDGILPVPVSAGGYAVAAAATWYSLRKINQKENPREDVPKAALLTAAFFVASWIHIPVPPASVHLVLNGLLGAVLGYFAFPAIVIGLFFQAVMFQHGGLTTLGANAVIMGLPALAAHYIFRLRNLGDRWNRTKVAVLGFLSGSLAVGISVAIFIAVLLTNLPSQLDAPTEMTAIYALAIAHLPLMGIEGVITTMLVLFIRRVRPTILDGV